ncbi:MAG: cell division protein SepF, partial [Candidatus Nanopelagicales bacterium]
MSTLHKVKAYFGMAPSDDYEDEYYEDEREAGGRSRLGRRGDRFADDDF